jgi:hypothetical protein
MMGDVIIGSPDVGKYHKKWETNDGTNIYIDVYGVLELFEVECSATQHAIKKLLAAGQRGQKGTLQDLTEAAASVKAAVYMESQR